MDRAPMQIMGFYILATFGVNLSLWPSRFCVFLGKRNERPFYMVLGIGTLLTNMLIFFRITKLSLEFRNIIMRTQNLTAGF